MDNFTQYLESLPQLQRVLWYIAIPSTILFAIMMLLTFFGLDGTDGVDSDIDTDVDDSGSAFQVWTFRNLIIFLTVYSWSSISFLGAGTSVTLSSVCSILIASATVILLTSDDKQSF